MVVDAAHSIQRDAWREIAGINDDNPSPLLEWARRTKTVLRDETVLDARMAENAAEISDMLEDVDGDRCWDYAIVDTPAVPDLMSIFSVIAANIVLCPSRTSADACDLSTRLGALATRRRRSFYSVAVGTDNPASIWCESIELPKMRCAIPLIDRLSVNTSSCKKLGLLGSYLPHASDLAKEVVETLDLLSQGRWGAIKA